MATVERRQQKTASGAPGTVRYRVRWRDPEGKQRSLSFARRRDADRWATEVGHQVLAGSYIDPKAGKITLRSYGEAWRKTLVGAPATLQAVEDTLRLHVYPVLGDRPLGAIRPSEIQGWVAGLDLGARSTVNAASRLSSLFKAAVRDRVITSNPCEGTKLPRPQRRHVVPPTAESIGKLAVAMPDDWRVIVALGSGLGLRAGEALGLTVDRIDFLGRQVVVDRQSRRTRGKPLELVPPKTAASVRTVPLPGTVGRALSAHIAAKGTGDAGVLIHSKTGGMQSSQRLSDMMSAACRKAGIGALRFHDLRHFYASLLIADGASVKTVQARLGHATAVETLDTYGHLWPDNEDQTRTSVDHALADVAYEWPVTG